MSELSDWRGICRPMYCDRMVLLLLGNAANWGLAIYGMVSTPKDFASYLLIIFLTNLLLYIAFYIIMKVSETIAVGYCMVFVLLESYEQEFKNFTLVLSVFLDL